MPCAADNECGFQENAAQHSCSTSNAGVQNLCAQNVPGTTMDHLFCSLECSSDRNKGLQKHLVVAGPRKFVRLKRHSASLIVVAFERASRWRGRRPGAATLQDDGAPATRSKFVVRVEGTVRPTSSARRWRPQLTPCPCPKLEHNVRRASPRIGTGPKGF